MSKFHLIKGVNSKSGFKPVLTSSLSKLLQFLHSLYFGYNIENICSIEFSLFVWFYAYSRFNFVIIVKTLVWATFLIDFFGLLS